MSFEIKNPQIEELLKYWGRQLKESMPEGWGFTIFLYSYGDHGSTFYLSSAQRNDMIELLKEFIELQEKEM